MLHFAVKVCEFFLLVLQAHTQSNGAVAENERNERDTDFSEEKSQRLINKNNKK